MSAQVSQAQAQGQWSNVLQHYGAGAYQTTDISPTNTSMGGLRSPPPAYSVRAEGHSKPVQAPAQRPRPRPTRRNSTAVPTSNANTPNQARYTARNTIAQAQANSLTLDESFSRSISLAFDTSASSSGTDDLESPPIETETDTATDSNVGIRHTTSRPSMRHFPSVSAVRRTSRSSSGGSEAEEEGYEAEYPRRMLHRDDLVGKPVAKKYMTVEPIKSKAIRLDNWFNTSGKKGSKLMSKLKSGGSKLSRLFSSDGEMAAGSSGSSDGQDQDGLPAKRTSTEISRRPSLTIDLSNVSTFQTDLLTNSHSQPRIPTPSFVLGRHGFSRYNPLPTIVGSPSIPVSPGETFHTPPTGLSPVFLSGFPITSSEEEGPRSLVGLFQPPAPTPLAVPVLTTRSSEATLVDDAMAVITPKDSSTIEREPVLDEPSTESSSPPTEDIVLPSPATQEDINLSIFSPRVHHTPIIRAVSGSPMCSPLELPSLDSPARRSLFESLSPHGGPFETGLSGLGLGTGSMMLSNSTSTSRSSMGSIRIKIDGCPTSASLTGLATALIFEDLSSTTPADPAPTADTSSTPTAPETPVRPTLQRASVDVNAHRLPIILSPRQSLPNTSTRAFSPLIGATSPRTPDSPHFTRPDFGPVSTPPSLIANPRSLGDPFPKGVPTSSSRNMAALANPEEVLGLGHLRRRSSGRIIDRYARGPISPPRKAMVVDSIAGPASESTTPMASPSMSSKATLPANPYFGQ